MPTASPVQQADSPRHSALVRVTHWLTVASFLALLVSGLEIVISHPRFYWGETGNVMTRPLFTLPIPSSRGSVPTTYGYVMPDQNGWSRALHFQSVWLLLFTGFVYVLSSLLNRHFSNNLVPARAERNLRAFRAVVAKHLHRAPPDPAEAHSYNVLQRTTYLGVIFLLFPLVILTGLALSPAFNAAFPFAVNLMGGRQSARTLHFFTTWLLVAFFLFHVAMIYLAGFKTRITAMITGRLPQPPERP